MSGAWNPTRWLSAPWGGNFRPAPGAAISPHLRLVRPVTGASAFNVWVADQLVLQIEVAVKFAAPDQVSESARLASTAPPEGLDRFLRQARCAAKIGDPHLVQILEQGKTKGVPFLVTELLEGRSLRQRLLAGALSLADAQAVLNQAAGVLARAHPLGLWHGSLCAEHLFLTETAGEPFLKIANFADVAWESGASSRLEPDAQAAVQGYLSPEQLIHGSGSGAAADLWALGVTLYELLTTTLPFEAPTSAGVRAAICNGQFSPPSHYRADVSPALDAWFARVFAPEPGARWLDPSELAREFARALGGGGMQAARRPNQVPSPLAAARDEHPLAEMDDQDADERTVEWDLPADWTLPRGNPAALSAPAPEPRSFSSGPSGGPPPLPDRRPSSRPPPTFPAPSSAPRSLSLAELASLSQFARATEPGGRVASPPRRARRSRARGLVAGALALFGGVGILLAWGYQGWFDGTEVPSPAASAQTQASPLVSAEGAERSSVTGSNAKARAPQPRPSSRPSPPAEQLPIILHTDKLPRAPEETTDDEETNLDGAEAGAPAENPGVARSIAGSAKSDPKPGPKPASKGNARLDPGAASGAGRPPTAPGGTAAPRPTARRSAKHSSVSASCNPPYFFDNNNIRRLKRECL